MKRKPQEREEENPGSDQRARSRAAAVTRCVSPGGAGRVLLPAEPQRRPIGARSARGGIDIILSMTIITYLPLISASVPIQPSVLPCGPPLRRASIGNGSAVSHAPQSFHWVAGRSIWSRGAGLHDHPPR